MDIKSLAVEGFYSHVLKIPSTWEFAPLHEVIELVGGSQPPKSDFKYEPEEGYVRLIQIRDYKSDDHLVYIPLNKARRFVSPEEVMIGRYGPPIFQILRGLEGAYNVALMKAAPVCDIFTNEYLFKYLSNQDLYNYVNSASDRTAGQSGVNKSHLEKYPVAVPPKAEQKVIADKLDTLLAQVETTKARLDRIPQILKTFRQSVLAAAVSGKLTEEWRKNPKLAQHDEIQAIVKRERQKTWLNEQFKSAKRKQVPLNEETVLRKYKQPVGGYLDEFELTQILDIPKDWLVANLDSVSIAVTGKTPSTTNEANWDGNIPFISPSQIMPSGSIVAPERNITSIAAAKTPIIPDGSVLIVCIGTIGKVGILEKESAFNQQINALIPTGAIKKEFLFMWAKTLHNWLNKTSSAVVNAAIINKSRLCLAPCPVPALEEQNEIVRCVEQLFAHADKIEQQVQAAQQRVNKLTQSILAKAFRGELTAQWRKDNTDLITGDNSAEALLAKIKAERESLTNKKKTTKKGKAKTV
jgi:type I restriction enzyme S subunit